MHHYRSAPVRRTPPPDAVRPQHSIHPAVPSASPPVILRFQPERHPAAPALLPRPNAHDAQPTFLKTSSPSSPPPPPSTRAPDFIVVGLFALRLTKRLIEGLEPYLYRDADISWLSTFLAQYPIEYALAKISGSRKDEYMSTYQEIVSRMKKQHRYPMRFMQLNPDRSVGQASSDGGRVNEREMTDLERLDIIDFCDAAGEWGSVVPIPASEAGRMVELAEQRRVADLEGGREPQVTRYEYEERRR